MMREFKFWVNYHFNTPIIFLDNPHPALFYRAEYIYWGQCDSSSIISHPTLPIITPEVYKLLTFTPMNNANTQEVKSYYKNKWSAHHDLYIRVFRAESSTNRDEMSSSTPASFRAMQVYAPVSSKWTLLMCTSVPLAADEKIKKTIDSSELFDLIIFQISLDRNSMMAPFIRVLLMG